VKACQASSISSNCCQPSQPDINKGAGLHAATVLVRRMMSFCTRNFRHYETLLLGVTAIQRQRAVRCYYSATLARSTGVVLSLLVSCHTWWLIHATLGQNSTCHNTLIILDSDTRQTGYVCQSRTMSIVHVVGDTSGYTCVLSIRLSGVNAWFIRTLLDSAAWIATAKLSTVELISASVVCARSKHLRLWLRICCTILSDS